jgi:hypothetical protein
MRRLALYLDENLDQRSLPTLDAHGCDTLTVRQTATMQASDEAQLTFAAAQGRLLLTHNQIHFRRLHHRFLREGRSHSGIVLVPHTLPLSRLAARLGLLVEWIGTFDDTHSRLFTWTDLQQDLIRGYRPPQTRYSEHDVAHALGWR